MINFSKFIKAASDFKQAIAGIHAAMFEFGKSFFGGKEKSNEQSLSSRLTTRFRMGVRKRIQKFNINMSNRIEDIINGYRVRVSRVGDKQYYKVDHDFYSGKNQEYVTTAAQAGRKQSDWRYEVQGSVIMTALDVGRKHQQWSASSGKEMYWGYPYPNKQKAAMTVKIDNGKSKIYKEGMRFTEYGYMSLESYFKQRVLDIKRAKKSFEQEII
jgi:hypothetical protein